MTLMDDSKNTNYPVIVSQPRILIEESAGLTRSYAPLAKMSLRVAKTEVYEMNKVSKD